jgi:hypothetical protein
MGFFNLEKVGRDFTLSGKEFHNFIVEGKKDLEFFCLTTVNREILVMVLFWPILAPKYEVPKLNTPKYVTLQKLTAKIDLKIKMNSILK